MKSRQTVLAVAICIVLPRAALIGRSELEAKDSWRAAQSAHERGETSEYLYQLQRCAKWNTLLGGYAEQAQATLIRFAQEAEKEGRIKDALVAWRYARGVLLSTDHVFRPNPSNLSDFNAAIEALMATEHIQSEALTIANRTRDELVAEHQALLSHRNGPSSGGAILIFGSFVLWIGSILWMIRKGIGADGHLKRQPLLKGGLCSLTLFASFCWALITF